MGNDNQPILLRIAESNCKNLTLTCRFRNIIRATATADATLAAVTSTTTHVDQKGDELCVIANYAELLVFANAQSAGWD